jgi:glycogen debranching enzyme
MGKVESVATAGAMIQVQDQYYILASSALADHRTRVLKAGETFAVFDRHGDIHPVGHGQQGLYHDSTRFLSRLELRIDEQQPVLLSSTVAEDNRRAAIDLTNPPLHLDGDRVLPQDSVHIFRTAVLGDGTCHQRIRLRNYALEAVRFRLTIRFAADFADIFEVRGAERRRSGHSLKPSIGNEEVALEYRGLDERVRRVRLSFDPTPADLKSGEARFDLALPPGGAETLALAAACECDAEQRPHTSYADASRAASQALEARCAPCKLDTTNERFNDWLNRSTADLRMMLTETPHGVYPYAGVPWFNAPFGRDGIVTALETLWIDPSIAAAVLRYLAATQASEEDAASDAEPGKILHEARNGEMCALGEVPFARYYGTVDATPLFVILAHAYYQRTADRQLVEEIWPNVLHALNWIDRCGDRDGDGFLEYERRTPSGLTNQGWKDSYDSVFHADGTLATGPIALCEVQAYVYGAKRGASALANIIGDTTRANALQLQAERLQARFEERFWLADLDTYALALDGEKKPCRVRTSNAGQCLWTGIVSWERAAAVARTLMTDESYSGWGIRTVATSEPRYNPMSYHNGSVWPHDNALVAAGMARYGLDERVLQVLAGLFDATLFAELNRLPELFCGFPRRRGEAPTSYPVACAPQSWASAAVYSLLQSILGVEISAPQQLLLLRNPVLPPFLEGVRVRNLRVGDATVDLDLVRHPGDVGIQVIRREGTVDIVVVK